MDTQPYQCDLLSLCPFTAQAAQAPDGGVAFSLAREDKEYLTGAPDHTGPWQWQLGCHCRAGAVFWCQAAPSPFAPDDFHSFVWVEAGRQDSFGGEIKRGWGCLAQGRFKPGLW